MANANKARDLTALLASLLIAGATLLAVGFILIITQTLSLPQPPGTVACTLEAKICPDGTAVGRTGPDCQFAACPTKAADETAFWKTTSDPATGVTFKYPSGIGTKYIFAQNWPPTVTVSAGEGTWPAVISAGTQYCTQPVRMINGNPYCVTEQEDGAAGTTFSNYHYSLPQPSKNRTIVIDFVLGSPECGNYSDPQMTECANERGSFSIDKLVDQIAGTVSP